LLGAVGTAERCQELPRAGAARYATEGTLTLLNDLVGEREQLIGHSEPERLRGPEIHDEFEFRRSLDWNVCGLVTA
jgi:hypothetical protein